MSDKLFVRDNLVTYFNRIFVVPGVLLRVVGEWNDMTVLISVAANSVIGSGEACKCEDHFKAAHPDTDWEAALIHSEKIGLGSREYELVKI